MRIGDVVRFYQDRRVYPYDQPTSEPDLVAEEMANVTDLGTDRSNQLLGNYVANAKVVRLIHPVKTTWDFCTINGSETHYRMQTTREPLKMNTLIVGEDISHVS